MKILVYIKHVKSSSKVFSETFLNVGKSLKNTVEPRDSGTGVFM